MTGDRQSRDHEEPSDMQVSAMIAAEAGALLMDLRSAFGSVDDEDSADELRRIGDRRSHEHIVARFAELRPRDIVLSEEGVDDPARLSADRVWIVGPHRAVES